MTTDPTAPVPPDANGLREAANPILSDALIYYAERRKMNNPKGWDHVARKVEQGLAADLWPHAEPEQVGQARRALSLLAASEAAPTAGEEEVPWNATCGCKTGGLHRYSCAGVGYVHPPRPATPPADDASEVARERADAAMDALAELVALKNGPRDADYERRKPLPWQAAQHVIDAYGGAR